MATSRLCERLLDAPPEIHAISENHVCITERGRSISRPAQFMGTRNNDNIRDVSVLVRENVCVPLYKKARFSIASLLHMD